MLIDFLPFFLSLALFIALAVAGFAKWNDPKPGTMVITGFVGFAVVILYTKPMWYWIAGDLKNAGIIDYELYLRLNTFFTPFLLWLPTLILLALGIIGLKSRRANSHSFVIIGFSGAVIAFLLTAFSYPGVVGHPKRASEAETKANMQIIQTGLQKYEADKGLYPEDVETLLYAGFMDMFPLNTYTIQPMKNVSYASPDCYGNITYLPLTVGNEVRGYYLIAYGYKDREGQHLVSPDINDHVILVVDSNSTNSPWPSDVPFPDIRSVIESGGR